MVAALTAVHVLLSLAGIAAGFIVVSGLIRSKRLDGWTNHFLWTTTATSVTGFLFPVDRFLPSHAVGILSLFALALAYSARYRFRLERGWRGAYTVAATVALYFNVFVLVVQLFQKVPVLRESAPTQSEPSFLVAQLAVLTLFLLLGFQAVKGFKPEPAVSRAALSRAQSR